MSANHHVSASVPAGLRFTRAPRAALSLLAEPNWRPDYTRRPGLKVPAAFAEVGWDSLETVRQTLWHLTADSDLTALDLLKALDAYLATADVEQHQAALRSKRDLAAQAWASGAAARAERCGKGDDYRRWVRKHSRREQGAVPHVG